MRHFKPDDRVRQAAMEIYKSFECMFGIPDKTTFSQVSTLSNWSFVRKTLLDARLKAHVCRLRP